MNKQSLYVLGGTLLASTALSTAGNAAAVLKQNSGLGGLVPTATITARPLATQLFSATATTANALDFGGSTTANGDILIDFALPITLPFRVELSIANASFTGTPGVVVYTQDSTSATASLAASSVSGCTVGVQPDKLLVLGCDPTGQASSSRADAMAITGVRYISAGALATAGQSITLSGIIKDSTATSTFDTITAAAVVTSKSALDVGFTAGGGVTIDSTVTPAFSKLTAATALTTTTANLGSIKFSSTSAVGTDLSFVYLASSVASTTEIKVTHGVLLDDALTQIAFVPSVAANTITKFPSQFVTNTVSFSVPGASLDASSIIVTFDGSSLIDTTSGTATAVVTPTIISPAGGGSFRVIPSFSGTLAALSRGGLSVEVNSLMPTAGQGSTLYRSYIRVANISPVNGIATISVLDDVTGATIGSFTTAQLTSAISGGLLSSTGEIRANSTLQIGAADIEALVTGAAATAHPYKVRVTGSFNGYVQNLMWNSVTGLFTDLSGFRNGVLTIDP